MDPDPQTTPPPAQPPPQEPAASPAAPVQVVMVQEQEIPEQTLLVWTAAARPFKKRKTRFFFNIAFITVFIFLLLLFFYQFALMAVLFSLVFVGIVINTIEPHDVEYQITNKGIRLAQDLFPWGSIKEFWQDTILEKPVVIVQATTGFPKSIIIVLDPTRAEEIVATLRQYRQEIKHPPATWADRRAQDLVRLVNLGAR